MSTTVIDVVSSPTGKDLRGFRGGYSQYSFASVLKRGPLQKEIICFYAQI